MIKCQTCLTLLTLEDIVRQGFTCTGCGLRICIHCGCTDEAACPGGCYWLIPGACSTHEAELLAGVEALVSGREVNL